MWIEVEGEGEREGGRQGHGLEIGGNLERFGSGEMVRCESVVIGSFIEEWLVRISCFRIGLEYLCSQRPGREPCYLTSSTRPALASEKKDLKR